MIVARGTKEIYQGHPNTVLLPDGKTMFCVWTLNHGWGEPFMKRSEDAGLTWTDTVVPADWNLWCTQTNRPGSSLGGLARGCLPMIHHLVDPQGRARLVLFDRGDKERLIQSVSEDGGRTWVAMRPNGLRGIEPSMNIIATRDGKRLLMWNTDWTGGVLQAESYDGGLTWTNERDVIEIRGLPGVKMIEPGVIRSPDGRQLLMLIRDFAEGAAYNSLYCVSDNEGATWSLPKRLPAGLTGDRHAPLYTSDGRLVVAMRDTLRNGSTPTLGHFIAWVGRYEDVVAGRDGAYRVKLLHSYAGGDCGYPSLQRLPDGTIVATTYIKYAEGPEHQSVVSTRFKIEELDAMLKDRKSILKPIARTTQSQDGKPRLSAAAATAVPSVNFAPGPEYDDSNRYFGICSSIVKTPGGRLWCGFSSGGLGESQFNYGVIVTSDDDGRTWSKPRIVFDTDGDGPIRSDHVVTWVSPTGQLWIMWSQYPQGLCGPDSSEWAITCDNPDAETPVWTAPRKIADGQNLLNKPIVLSDGSWLFPTGSWHYRSGDAHMRDYDFPSRPLLSRDGGRSFQLGGPLLADQRPDFDEYMVIERTNGTLVLFDRANGLLEGTSLDRGKTWSKLQLNGIPHTNARFVFMRLRSGNWLLVKHGDLKKVAGRTRLTAFLSTDEGKSWTGGLVLDERAISYPDGFQAEDGRIYVSYERSRFMNPEILMAVFTEADVAAGKVVSEVSRLKVLVNKATGNKAAFRADPRNAKYLKSDGEPPREDSKDGNPLLTGSVAALDIVWGEVRKLGLNLQIFSNRKYVFDSLPAALAGKSFVFSTMEKTEAVCRKSGVVYVLTPRPQRNARGSLETALLQSGFTKAAIPEFNLFPGDANLCSIYQKRVEAGERIELGFWGVLVF